MIGSSDTPNWFDWRGSPLLTPKWLFGCLGIMALAVLICILGLYLDGLRRERIITAYLAEVGGVRATYESVDAFMQREFPTGMSRQEVVAKLDAKFIHAFAHWADSDNPHYFTVCFPERGYSEESFRLHMCCVRAIRSSLMPILWNELCMRSRRPSSIVAEELRRLGTSLRTTDSMKTDKTSLDARAYSGPDDLQAMIDLLIRVRLPDRLADCPRMVDLQEWFSLPDLHADTRLWFGEGGGLVVFAFADAFNNLRFEALPDVMRVLEEEAVSWGQECILRRPHSANERITLDASCREEDSERIAMLRRHGFQMLPIRSLHLVRPLSEPTREPALPPGFAIRAAAGLDEAEALAALHRAAFGTERMTTEERLSMMTTPEYDPSLDLVAVAPDGTLVAYCMCYISTEENARAGRKDGCADPVATHPRFRRQGLARALLLRGLRLLRERGMDFARLGTSSDNIAMQRAAQSVGFGLGFANVWFEKPIGPAK